MNATNNSSERHAIVAILGEQNVEDMEALLMTRQELLVQAALACFDNEVNDANAQAIRKARKELAE